MDVVYPLLTVGCADRQILSYDLSNPSVVSKVRGLSLSIPKLIHQLWQEMTSPLKHQIRSIACFPSADGFTIGTVEGRVAVQYVVLYFETSYQNLIVLHSSFTGDES